MVSLLIEVHLDNILISVSGTMSLSTIGQTRKPVVPNSSKCLRKSSRRARLPRPLMALDHATVLPAHTPCPDSLLFEFLTVMTYILSIPGLDMLGDRHPLLCLISFKPHSPTSFRSSPEPGHLSSRQISKIGFIESTYRCNELHGIAKGVNLVCAPKSRKKHRKEIPT